MVAINTTFEIGDTLTTVQLARIIGVTDMTIRNMCSRGLIPHIRIGCGTVRKSIRIRTADARKKWPAFFKGK